MAHIVFDDLEVKRRIIEDLADHSPISPILDGSIGNALVDSIVARFREHVGAINLGLSAVSPMTAVAGDLDLWGDLVGVKRVTASPAIVDASDRNIKFYVANGTFGNINDGNDIIVPQGTIIETGPDYGEVVQFRVLNDTTLPSGLSEVYVGAISTRVGVVGNVPPSALVRHGFTGYVDFLSRTLLVTNTSSITTGLDEESDNDYRRRIIDRLRGDIQSTAGLLNMLRALPSVSDVVLFFNTDGLGTATIVIQGTTPQTTETTLSSARFLLNNIAAIDGINYVVRAPSYVGVGMDIVVRHNSTVSEEAKTGLENQIKTTIANYISNLGIGVSLDINALERVIAGFSVNVEFISQGQGLIDKLYRYDNVFGQRIPEIVENSIEIEEYEKLIIEPSIQNPVNIIRVV